jgi:hypothetical protein
MKPNKPHPLFAITAVIVSILACSLGSGGSPAAPVEQDETQQAPIVNTPPVTNAPATGGCINPYLPVIVGAAWTYQLTGPAPDTFTHTILSADEDGFIEQDAFASGVTRQAEWKCENGNLIALNPPGGNSANVSAEGVQADFETSAIEGVTLPASINPGDTWSQSLTLEGTETINGNVVPVKNQAASSCTAVGIEPVTVPAGTFDALRVECTIQMNISMTLNGAEIPTILDLSGIHWYALNVGLIKTSSTGANAEGVTELVTYKLP